MQIGNFKKNPEIKENINNFNSAQEAAIFSRTILIQLLQNPFPELKDTEKKNHHHGGMDNVEQPFGKEKQLLENTEELLLDIIIIYLVKPEQRLGKQFVKVKDKHGQPLSIV